MYRFSPNPEHNTDYYYIGRDMLHCIHGDPICDGCWKSEIYNQNNVLIAQFQRLLDLTERREGYDNVPLCLQFAAPTVGAVDSLPAFEMGALIQSVYLSTDATAITATLYLAHSSIPLPNARLPLTAFQGTGTFSYLPGKLSVPRNGIIQVVFTAATGGTYVNLSASYSRSEETGIEYFRTQRAGRVQ